jgi:multiple antibiotic resistance protein
MGVATTILVFGALCLITFLCFIYSARILSVVGKSGMAIVTRLMGLILAIIGTQMAIEGITDVMNLPN